MVASFTYRDYRIAELRRQELLEEAARVRLGTAAAMTGDRTGAATLRCRLGGLLVRTGEALQGTTGTQVGAAVPTVPAVA